MMPKDGSEAIWLKWGIAELSPKSSGDIFKIMQEVVKDKKVWVILD